MRDVKAIRAAWQREAKAGRSAVLATLVETEGSTYRRAGARALFVPFSEAESCVGLLSGGCLEPDLLLRAKEVLSSGEPRLAVYDMRSPDDIVFGLGLGCEGRLAVWLEPVNPQAPAPFLVAPPGTGLRTAWRSETGEERFFEDVVPLPWRIALHGAGEDAKPLCALLELLGCETHVYDRREGVLAQFQSPGVVSKQSLERLSPGVCSSFDALVLMSHHFESDARVLQWAVESLAGKMGSRGGLKYIGCLGPAKRREKLFAEVPAARYFFPNIVKAPAGLDVGGDSPEAIALSIVAEMHAVLCGRNEVGPLSARLRDSRERIHEPGEVRGT